MEWVSHLKAARAAVAVVLHEVDLARPHQLQLAESTPPRNQTGPGGAQKTGAENRAGRGRAGRDGGDTKRVEEKGGGKG